MNGAQRAAFNEMTRIGDQMSNACFNLQQKSHIDLANTWPQIRDSLRDLQQQWDAARKRYFELEHEAREAKKTKRQKVTA